MLTHVQLKHVWLKHAQNSTLNSELWSDEPRPSGGGILFIDVNANVEVFGL